MGGGTAYELPDRGAADALLGELVRAGAKVTRFGPRTLKLFELLKGVGGGEGAAHA